MLETGDGGKRLLERPHHELFHLRRADARVLHPDRDARVRHVRHEVHGQPEQRDRAEKHDHGRQHEHRDGTFNRKARDTHRRISFGRLDCRRASGRPVRPGRCRVRGAPRPAPSARPAAARSSATHAEILSPSRSASAPTVTSRVPSLIPSVTSTKSPSDETGLHRPGSGPCRPQRCTRRAGR